MYDNLYFWTTIAIIPIMLLGIIASVKVNMTFSHYKSVLSDSGVTGAEAARKILDEAGLRHVSIVRTNGHLSDHYDPRTQIIALSQAVYDSTSVASLGVAAHEAGHALQHAQGYIWIKARTALVPVINVTSRLFWPLLLVGMIISFINPDTMFGAISLFAGLIMFGVSALFSFVTLPVEFDASNRAISQLRNAGILSTAEIAGTRKVLSAAAMTYVVSFIMALVQFLRILAIFMSRRRN